MVLRLQPLRLAPSGTITPSILAGSSVAQGTADVELIRRTLEPNESKGFSSVFMVTRQSDRALAQVATSGLLLVSRNGNAAPTFSVGTPAPIVLDPNGLGVGLAFAIDGNDVVMTGTNGSGADLLWTSQVIETFAN